MKVLFLEGLGRGFLCGSRFCHRSAVVTKDGGVDTTGETSGTNIGVRTNPVISDRFISIQLLRHEDVRNLRCRLGCTFETYNEGITLASKDLDGIDLEGLAVNTIDFNNGHVMIVDGEDMVGLAREGHETETVTGGGGC